MYCLFFYNQLQEDQAFKMSAELPPVTSTNLAPVSTTPAANFAISSAGVVDTGVNNASGKLPPVSTTPAANLPPVANNAWEQYQTADNIK
jgi:hypothetical protein